MDRHQKVTGATVRYASSGGATSPRMLPEEPAAAEELAEQNAGAEVTAESTKDAGSAVSPVGHETSEVHNSSGMRPVLRVNEDSNEIFEIPGLDLNVTKLKDER